MKPLQKSLNQSLPYHLLPVLTAILVTTEEKNISLLPELNKHNVVGAIFVKVITWSCLSCDMDLSKLLHGFAEFVTWNCQSSDLDLSKLLD